MAPTYNEIIVLSETLHAESLGIISNLPDLNAKCTTPDGASMTVWKWLRAMTEHEIHHRGQIYTYLALLEVPTPPLFGLTSEQIMQRSARS
ncbi:MAG TPA: DinB family protein [Terriglobales bacterium]|nr:DinB family protein [Terriglobales bacterium]